MLAKCWQEISTCGSKGKLGNDVEVFKLQPESDHLLAEGGEVVLVGFADLFDQAVKASRFSGREIWPLVLSCSRRRRFLLWKPLILNSPRARDWNNFWSSSSKKLKPR